MGRLASAAVWAAAGIMAQPAAGGATSLPQLPSGGDELQWIDEHLPENGAPSARREALEEVLRMFSGDPATVFRANVRIAIVDWDRGSAAAAGERLEHILGDTEGVDRDLIAWAEVLDGRVLADVNRVPDALRLLKSVLRDGRVLPARRSIAASVAAELLISDAPGEALSLLQEAAADAGGPDDAVQAGIAHVLLRTGKAEELTARLGVMGESDKGEAQLTALVNTAAGWNLPGDAERIIELCDMLALTHPNMGKVLGDAIAQCRAQAAIRTIQERLLKLRASRPLAAWMTSESNAGPLETEPLQRSIDQAAADRNPRRCLQLELRLLCLPRGGSDFPRRLWQAAGFADWVERSSGGASDGTCELLLNLCDMLPVGDDFWKEGKFLRAERRARAGDRAGEQAILNEVLASAGLRTAYLAAVCLKLGSSLEASREDQKALVVYGSAEPAANFSAGAEALLHAVLINLRLNNDEEAIRLIGLLQAAPAKAIELTSSPGQIRDLVALVQSGHAAEYWAAGRKWWTGWRQIAEAAGVPVDSIAERVPVTAEVGGLEAEARHAAETGDRSGYFRRFDLLMSAARWQPSVGPEAASISAPALHFAPDQRQVLRALLIRMLECPHAQELPNLRKRELFLAANDLNAHSPDEALRVAAQFESGASRADPLAPAMHQIRGLAALDAGRDYALALGDLEADLATGKGPERAMTAGVIADLYHRLGRDEDARALLARELKNPALAADAATRAQLAAHLNRLTGGQPVADRPAAPPEQPPPPPQSQRIEDWLHSISFRWFDQIAPKSLDDPDLPELAVLLKDPAAYLPPAGQIKTLLLAANAAQLSPAQRQDALGEAIVRLMLSARSVSRLELIARSVVDSPAFVGEIRLRALWTILAQLAESGRNAEYAEWRKRELCSQFSDEFQHQLALLDRQAALERGAPRAVSAWARELGASRLDLPAMQTLADLFGALLRRGDREEAQAIATAASSWQAAPRLEPAWQTLKLEFARKLRLAARLNPVHEAMSSVLLRDFPAPAPRLAPEVADQLDPGSSTAELYRPGLATCIFLATARNFERDDLNFWGAVFGSLPAGSEGAKVGSDLLHAGLAAATDDALRAELVIRFFSSADIDDPAVRSRAEREFSAFRQPSESPQTFLAVRLYEVHRDLRLGLPFVPEIAYRDLTDPRIPTVRARDSLRYFTRVSDRSALGQAVDAIDAGGLVGPSLVADAIPALAMLDRKTELREARAAARGLLQRDVGESWIAADPGAADAALDLALALGEPGTLPREWVQDLGADVRLPLLEGRARLVRAYLALDWPEVLAAAAALRQQYPSRYTFSWYEGKALHELHRDGEAVGPLQIYVRRARDEADFPRAAALLASIRGALSGNAGGR